MVKTFCNILKHNSQHRDTNEKPNFTTRAPFWAEAMFGGQRARPLKLRKEVGRMLVLAKLKTIAYASEFSSEHWSYAFKRNPDVQLSSTQAQSFGTHIYTGCE